MAIELGWQQDDKPLAEPEDATAEVIAGLSQLQADLLWAALIQLKPHLRD
jgi:hypothetical protein